MEEKVLKVIEDKINPKLLEHQGWIELVRIEDNTVYIRFRGACSSCMSTYDTFDDFIKPELMKEIKEINEVKIQSDVSEELLDFARSILNKNK